MAKLRLENKGGRRRHRGLRPQRRYPSLLGGAAVALVLCWPFTGRAAEIEGVSFDDVVEVGGQRLALNGTGLREVYIVKTWVAALYTPEPVDNAAVLISDAGPRRIAITLLADLSIERVARSMLDGLRRNHDPILLAAIEKQIAAFVAALASIGPTEKGDTLTLDLANGATRLGFNGMSVGEPVEGLLFRDALLRAFVGEQPIDEGLRRGLLGLPDDAEVDSPVADPQGGG